MESATKFEINMEQNRVIVGGCPSFEDYFGVAYLDQDRQFLEGYRHRPLKRVSVGDVVLVRPKYLRFVVVGLSADGKGLNLVTEYREEEEGGGWYRIKETPPVVVEFDRVRVEQAFLNSGGGTTRILLRPDFRAIHPEAPVPVWGDGSETGWDTWINSSK